MLPSSAYETTRSFVLALGSSDGHRSALIPMVITVNSTTDRCSFNICSAFLMAAPILARNHIPERFPVLHL
jgi:hypothetical protein